MVARRNPGDIVELMVRRPLQEPYLQMGEKKLRTPEEIAAYLSSLNDGETFRGVYHSPSVEMKILLVLQKGW